MSQQTDKEKIEAKQVLAISNWQLFNVPQTEKSMKELRKIMRIAQKTLSR